MPIEQVASKSRRFAAESFGQQANGKNQRHREERPASKEARGAFRRDIERSEAHEGAEGEADAEGRPNETAMPRATLFGRRAIGNDCLGGRNGRARDATGCPMRKTEKQRRAAVARFEPEHFSLAQEGRKCQNRR